MATMQTAASSNPMYKERRQAIVDTWLPALAALPRVGHAFVVGTPQDNSILMSIAQEERELGAPFLVLDTEARFLYFVLNEVCFV
jgi:hypothetical protein